jgi:hypothetical protein
MSDPTPALSMGYKSVNPDIANLTGRCGRSLSNHLSLSRYFEFSNQCQSVAIGAILRSSRPPDLYSGDWFEAEFETGDAYSKPLLSRYTSVSSCPSRTTSGVITPFQRPSERSGAHSNAISSRSPEDQHRSEYRSLAVMRNAHTA